MTHLDNFFGALQRGSYYQPCRVSDHCDFVQNCFSPGTVSRSVKLTVELLCGVSALLRASVLEENLSLGHLWERVTSDIAMPTFLGKKFHLSLCNPDKSLFMLASLDVTKGLPGL